MRERAGYLVEFLVVAFMVFVSLIGLMTLALTGHAQDNADIVDVLRTIVTAGFGAVVALAYAARGATPVVQQETHIVRTSVPPAPPTEGPHA